MVYPIFEYSFLLYILLDYCQIKNDMLNGIFPAQKAKLMKTMFWIKVVLVAWFRMIFICKVRIFFWWAPMKQVIITTVSISVNLTNLNLPLHAALFPTSHSQ